MEETVPDTPAEDVSRPRLDRERILDAAEAIVREEGVGRLTMRRIGAELGADPTAVYRHFRNKDELLIQLADRLFGIAPDLPPDLSWRERFKAELRYSMNRYRSHPDLAMLLAVQPDDTPSLQAIAEWDLARLAEIGLSPEDAARVLQVIENHVVGTGLYYALIEHGDDPRLRDTDAMRRVYALLPAGEFPHAVVAAPHLFPDLDESFDFATDMILDAIERLAGKGDAATGSTDEGAGT
ncbi:MAG TPA: TetR/AcrR family transcriptional regulator [Capillimicrobium sp.]|nr:TetR/AcrR family transcriptional regulator [Capillimicrobium sp.]